MFRAARGRRGSEQERGLKQALTFFVPYVKEVIADSCSIFNVEKAVRQGIREGHATWSVLTVRGAEPKNNRACIPNTMPIHSFVIKACILPLTTYAGYPLHYQAY
ncbi:hypothetical protein M514_21506 [Trichuris suis]|uniref:Uncharacterized protein n=1 Tax=Trichuris suis TaxID=68888 RepID=A0A085N9S3_9BILA|nr:hypothetical protein M514_21506 [Trichuris suis]